MKSKRPGRFLFGCALSLLLATVAWSYSLITDSGGYVVTWTPGPIPMQVKLPASPVYGDGFSQSSSVVAAMNDWNAQLGVVQFAPTELGPGAYGVGNDVNEIAMDSTIDGEAFGSNTLAVTVSFRSGNERIESDIIFNTAWTWDSYRGNLQAAEDIRRVAIHELGHVLGLNHPDQAGQSVTAIMNSTVSNIAALQTDDITGGQTLYGAPGFVPANNNFANATTINLSGGSAQVTGANVAATAESGEPAHAGETARRSVWWKWTAPSNGTVTITTLGSKFDTVMGVYTGSSVGALVEVASSDDADSGVVRTSAVVFNVTSGTTYAIAVDGWDGYFGPITLNLSLAAATAPSITLSPASQAVLPGATANFVVAAVGTGSLIYRWQTSANGLNGWTDLNNDGTYSGVTTATLSLAASASLNGYSYRCVVTDSVGSAVSQPASLMVAVNGPALMNRPLTKIVTEGQPTAFTITAVGVGSLSYQWKRDGLLISGQSGATLDLGNASPADRGRYEVIVTDTNGSARSVFYLHVAQNSTTLAAWGRNDGGQTNVPTNLESVGVIRAGRNYGMAVKADGTVVRWGVNAPAAPVGLTGVVDVSIGGAGQSIALKNDGTLVGWGQSGDGQLDFPAGLTDVVALSSNMYHSIALRANGTVVTWGHVNSFQGPTPTDLNDIVAVAAGSEHFLALRADGSVVEWGQVWGGGTAKPANLTDVIAIAAGDTYNMALRSSGTVVVWRDTNGFVPVNLSNVTAIAAGAAHKLALLGNRSVVAWDQSSFGYGETNVPSSLGNVSQIDAGLHYSVALYASGAGLPVITGHPASQATNIGQSVTFTVAASGAGLSYQWRRNGAILANGGNISGATSAALTLSGVQANDAGSYTVIVRNSVGSVLSSATLSIVAVPVITTRPASRVVAAGQSVTFVGAASGSGLTYQWKHNGRVIAGATGPSMTLSSVTLANRGRYEFVVTNGAGQASRSVFMLYTWSPNSWITAWGGNNSGQTNVPVGLNDVVALSAGSGYSLVVRSNGTVQGWGANHAGQITVPAGLNTAIAVAAAGTHSVALKTDGTVVAWGNNDYGQSTVPAGLNNVVSIVASSHNLALRADGTVVAWGRNYEGQTNVPAGLSDVVAVSAGYSDSLALKADGSIVVWGYNGYRTITTLAGQSLVSATLGLGGILVVKTDGTLVTMSLSGSLQTNAVAGLTDISALTAGGMHNLVLKSDGTVTGWGNNDLGQTTIPAGLVGVFDFSAGSDYNLALVSTDLPPVISEQPQNLSVVQGEVANFVVTANGGPPITYQWQRWPAGGSTWSNLSNGGAYSGVTTASLTVTGSTLGMTGDQFQCVVSNPHGATTSFAATLTVLDSALVSSASAGFYHSLFTTGDGTLWGMGSNFFGQLGVSQKLGDSAGPNIPVLIATGVARAVPVKGFHSLFIKSDATLWGMGANNSGSLGDGTFTHRSTPVQIATGVQSASGGNGHTLFIKSDGTLWGVGNNQSGQLGDGTFTNRNIPVQVASGVIAVSAGEAHSLYVKTDGSLWAMGLNFEGQLGDGTQVNRANPVQIATGVSKVEGAGAHSFFIKTDGTLWGMGANNNAQLGDGTTTRRLTPVQIASGVVTVSSSGQSLFIKTNGTLWGMGGNDSGQLGTYQASNFPVQITAGVSAVSAGAGHTLFIKTDGTLWGMGSNNYGQLGDGTYTNRGGSPVALGLAAPSITTHPISRNVSLLATADFHVVATGAVPMTYQWQRLPVGESVWGNLSNNGTYSGATGTDLTVSGATLAMSGDQFRCVATNTQGSATSNAATLTVTIPLPVITTQPLAATVAVGSSINLFVIASSPVTLSYQWQKDGTPISAANTAMHSISPTQLSDSGSYTVVVTNSAGSVTSTSAAVVVAAAPAISTHPVNLTVYAGQTASFAVVATSAAPLSYAWRKLSTPIAGATQSSYSITNAQVGDAGDYSVMITNVAGSVFSNAATLTVNPATAPVITTQPVGQSAGAGVTVQFTVAATGAPAPAYQWQVLRATGGTWGNTVDGAGYSGSQTATLSVLGSQMANNGDQYRCVASNVAGSATSNAATHTVLEGPVITVHPQSQTGLLGLILQFSVTATGVPAPTYQWQRRPVGTGVWADLPDGIYVTGSTTPTLTVTFGAGWTDQDQVRCVVSNYLGSVTSNAATLSWPQQAGVVRVAGGAGHTVFIRSDGVLYTTGANGFGQLGRGNTTNVNFGSWVDGPDLGNLYGHIIDVAAGANHSFYLKSNATLWAMGRNANGQLGTGDAANRLSPVQVAAGVAAAAPGTSHSLFIKQDGTLWVTGDNTYGQLGDGTNTNTLVPKQVATHVVAAASAFVHSVFLKSDGTLWSMGHNGLGELGDGSPFNRNVPVQTATGVVAFSARGYHTLFIKTDGTLWTVGYNNVGQLGDGTLDTRATPVQVATNVMAVASGMFHSLFVKTDGTLWATGDNTYGQLGTGDTFARSSPVQVGTGVIAVAAGENHSAYITTDGSYWAMGRGDSGQLGDQFNQNRATPFRIMQGYVPLPAPPTAVTASDVAYPDRIAVSWTGGLSSGYYELWRGTTNVPAAATRLSARVSTPYYEDLSATPNQPYYYWVKGVNAAGVGAFSAGDAGLAGSITPPVITTPPQSQTVNVGANVTFSVTASGTAPFTYQWRKGGNAIGGATASSYAITGAATTDAGSYDVVVTNGAGSGTSAAAVLTVNKLAQAITFTAPADRAYTPLPFGLVATSDSGLPVTFSIVSGPATLDGSDLTLTGVGTVTVRAGQGGNGSYLAATNVDRSFVVSKAVATVTLGDLAATYDGTAKSATATTSPAGLNVVLTYDGGATAPTNAGSYTVAGTIDEANYEGSATGTLVIAKAPQTITFAGPASQPYSPTPIALSATADSGLPVTFAIVSGPATVSGSNLTLTGTGTVTVRASQAGDSNRLAAPSVDRSFNSNKLSQTITFAPLADRAYTTVPQALTATASSGLPVSFSLVSGPATLNGSDLTITGVGTVTVRADQAGNSFYLAAANVDRSFVVSKAVATVTLGDLAAIYDGTAKSVTAVTAPAGLVVDFTYDGGAPAPTNAGSYAIVGTVNEANYQGSASGTLVIAKADQTIIFTGPANQPYSTTPVALSATAGSGLAVTFTVVSGPATVAGDSLTLTGAGSVTVRAMQDGDANRNAAPAIDRSFTVTANLASWQLGKFTGSELLDVNISGPNADPDHDGFTNLMEYALGLEPKSVSSAGLPQVGTESSDWAFTYTRPADRTDVTYEVECSTNLTSWSTAGVTHELVSSSGGTETWRARYPLASATNAFFRLKIMGP